MSKLLENLRSVMRLRHYSYQTEKTYIYWIRQYIFFDKITHPGQKRARLRSRLFKRIWWLKKKCRLQLKIRRSLRCCFSIGMFWELTCGGSTVFARQKVPPRSRSANEGRGKENYRRNGRRELLIRDGNGGKDRFIVLPSTLIKPLRGQLSMSEDVHFRDLRRDSPRVRMTFAIERKYPNALGVAINFSIEKYK